MKPNDKITERKEMRSRFTELKRMRFGAPRQMEKLEVPFQRGWVREYVLTEDAQKRPDAHILAEILGAINHKQYHWRKDFKMSKSEKRRKRMDSYYYPEQNLGSICDIMWERKMKTYPHWRKYFNRRAVMDGSTGKVSYRWFFNYPRLFTITVNPNIIRELPVLIPEEESRWKRFWNWIYKNGKTGLLNKSMGWHRHWDSYDTERMRLLKREMAKDLKEEY